MSIKIIYLVFQKNINDLEGNDLAEWKNLPTKVEGIQGQSSISQNLETLLLPFRM